jgi:hypothetical protein
MHVQQAIAALVPKLRNLRQLVIAAVNGPASGGGLALALASDIRIAAGSATFNAAFVRIGLSGCDIGVSWLPQLIGAGSSHELLLTGRLVDAAEARPDRPGHSRRPRRRDAGRGADHGSRDHGKQPDGRLDDQGGGLEPALGRQPPGRGSTWRTGPRS